MTVAHFPIVAHPVRMQMLLKIHNVFKSFDKAFLYGDRYTQFQ